ncbi:rhomboid-related protein 4-like isoform X2 [Anabas testudineus]|uniref:rhomboid-related protein 4-like isoform X2 n=1 Tax=Anabas testudineus TaxID=64144 RepID=UPI000E458B88|nr:rhomboid-related protein 4-like isoform X2 [Anabas testudineus]
MWNRRRGSQLGLLLLASQVFQVGLDNIPPVTLGVLALNVYLYMFPVAPPMQTCVSVQQACWLKDWRRLLLSPVHHVDDLHLYFNMVSFIWKGIRLERRLGGSWFLYLLSVFSLLSGLVYLVLEALLTELTQDQSYSMSCAVGFSDVLFALKVLNNHYHPGGVTYMLGVPVSNRYASWVELVLIHILSPGTSFVGHLSGILVGLLYTAGPLETIMKKCSELMTSKGYNPQRRQYFRSSAGYSGHHQQAPDYTTNNTSYSGGLTDEEQLETAIRNSQNNGAGYSGHHQQAPDYTTNNTSYSGGLTDEEQLETAVRNSQNDGEARAEEIRLRRLRRFDNGTTRLRKGRRSRCPEEEFLLKPHPTSASIGCSELMTSNGYNPQPRQYFRSSAGYSGHHQQAPDYTTNYRSYSGGLTEEEQLETAIRNSLYDRAGYSGHHQQAPDYTTNNTSYSGGLTEEEQLETAIRNSLYDRAGYSGHHQQAPDYTTNNTSYSGGLTDEEQLETAVRNSQNDGALNRVTVHIPEPVQTRTSPDPNQSRPEPDADKSAMRMRCRLSYFLLTARKKL